MYLLDTNALINMLCAPQKLTEEVRAILQTEEILFVSVVSLWEIAIKQFIKKLNINSSIEEIEKICLDKNVSILQISSSELEKTKTLPDVHRDPFDRLIISQAILNNYTVITSDANFDKYPVDVLFY